MISRTGQGPLRCLRLSNCSGRRIDQIRVSSHLRTIRSRLALSRASDHRPVVTDLVLVEPSMAVAP